MKRLGVGPPYPKLSLDPLKNSACASGATSLHFASPTHRTNIFELSCAMKTTPVRSLLLMAGLVLGSLSAVAASAPNEATVLKITGTATMTIPGGAPQALQLGSKIPQGATVNTGPGAELHIQPFDGTVTTINANTSVTMDNLSLQTDNSGKITKQSAKLNLRSGNMVSTIDPTKKSINDYAVSTPKGVAAARGSQLSTGVQPGDVVTISANADSISFTQANGTVVTISQGSVLVTTPGAGGAAATTAVVTLASLANSTTPEAVAAKAAIQAGVTAMATVLQSNLGGLSAQGATDLAAKVVTIAVIANPTGAAATTATIVNAMTTTTAENANGAGSQAPNANDATAIATIINAATVAAPEQSQAIASASNAIVPPALQAMISKVAFDNAPPAQQAAIQSDLATVKSNQGEAAPPPLQNVAPPVVQPVVPDAITQPPTPNTPPSQPTPTENTTIAIP